jgi:phospholipase C
VPPASAIPLQTALQYASNERTAQAKLAGINNIVVIFLENRSFDELYGTFPGVLTFSSPGGIPGWPLFVIAAVAKLRYQVCYRLGFDYKNF